MIVDRATEIEKNNLNLFNKMRAIIRTKHSTWRNKMMNRKLLFPPAAFAQQINSRRFCLIFMANLFGICFSQRPKRNWHPGNVSAVPSAPGLKPTV